MPKLLWKVFFLCHGQLSTGGSRRDLFTGLFAKNFYACPICHRITGFFSWPNKSALLFVTVYVSQPQVSLEGSGLIDALKILLKIFEV